MTRLRKNLAGFTLTEMCIGLIVTSLVTSAMAAFSLAMARAWETSESTQALTLVGHQAMQRILAEVRGAKLIGYCRSGTSDGATAAAVVLWKADTNSDGLIQGGETEMIAYNAAAHTIAIYPVISTASATTWSYSTLFSTSAVLAQFSGTTGTPIARTVYGAVFQTLAATSTTSSPQLAFAIKFQDQAAFNSKTQLLVEYGTAATRAPAALPTN